MRRGMSLGTLANLFLAWEAGEVSEGRMVELTGLDRVSLRDLKLSAIEQGTASALRTSEEMEEVHRYVVERSASMPSEPGATTRDPEN